MAMKKKENFEDLYVRLYDTHNKRKNILSAIKNSLIMQEELEKVVAVRKQKAEVLSMIKKKMSSINQDYQSIKKLLPNVKNVISYTEKELSSLETQVSMLNKNIFDEKNQIQVDKELIRKLNSSKNIDSFEDTASKNSTKKLKKTALGKSSSKAKLSKLDRIKNNLKVIESKLNHL